MVISAVDLSTLPSDADPQQWRCWPSIPDRGAAAQRVYRPEAGRVGGAERRQFRCRAVGDRLRENTWPEDRQHRPAPGARGRARGDRGDVIVVDSPDVSERIKAAVGHAELRLALDGVSGPATGVLAATLSPRGTLVSFAA